MPRSAALSGVLLSLEARGGPWSLSLSFSPLFFSGSPLFLKGTVEDVTGTSRSALFVSFDPRNDTPARECIPWVQQSHVQRPKREAGHGDIVRCERLESSSSRLELSPACWFVAPSVEVQIAFGHGRVEFESREDSCQQTASRCAIGTGRWF